MSNIADFEIENGVLIKYHGDGGDVVIPDGITSIGFKAFSNCENLENIVIPSSVTDISDSAFENCTSLTSVVIPYGVTTVRFKTFCGCKSLTSIFIPDSVSSIWNEAFWDCHKLTRIVCSDKVTKLFREARLEARSLGYFLNRYISDSVTEEETQGWFDFIKNNATACLKTIKNNVSLYRLAIENEWLTCEDIDEILPFTDSIECRAMLMDYKKNIYIGEKI